MLRSNSRSIRNVGSNVNSTADDHSPVLTTDESSLYYTSRKKSNKNTEEGNLEKIYHSVLSSNVWSQNFLLEKFFRNFENESALSLSADGTELFLIKNDNDGQNLYETILKGGKWGKPFKLPEPINSAANETHACLSPDKSTLIFTSDREGGFGGKDIYWVKRDKNNQWTSIQNLGPNINSSEDEETPILHYDGKTLYFASEGHNSMGRMDIFYSQMNSDSTWSPAINLGYPINTPDDDFYFAPSVNKDHAYYASAKQDEGYGGSDIYRVEFKDFVQGDLAVVVANVNPTDPKNLDAGNMRIMVTQKDPKKEVGNYIPNKDGEVTMFLETNKEYEIVQKEEGIQDKPLADIEVPVTATYKPGNKFTTFASLAIEPPLLASNKTDSIAKKSDEDKSPNTLAVTETATVVTPLAANTNTNKAKVESNETSNEIKPNVSTNKSENEKAKNLTVTERNIQEIEQSDKKTYTIQLLALKRRSKPFKGYFEPISGYKIKKHRCIDGYTRYTIGTFNSKQEALKALNDLQHTTGTYKDAFIRNSKHHGEDFTH